MPRTLQPWPDFMKESNTSIHKEDLMFPCYNKRHPLTRNYTRAQFVDFPNANITPQLYHPFLVCFRLIFIGEKEEEKKKKHLSGIVPPKFSQS